MTETRTGTGTETETPAAFAARIRPRIEAELLPAPRLEAESIPLPVVPRAGMGTLSLALAGATVLVGGLSAVATADFVLAQFDRGGPTGWLALAIAVAGFGLLGTAVWRELRGLLSLGRVDGLRADLASGDPARMRRAAARWAARLPAEAVLPPLDAVQEPQAVLALLRAGPGAVLRGQVDALGRSAAVQAGALVAATPSPGLDALVVGWRGLRLVRQVAALHGVRPGALGTLALLRRTAFAAASVAATELAVNAATHAVLSNPLLERVLGDMAGAGVAARRMVVLARAAAIACSPLPEP